MEFFCKLITSYNICKVEKKIFLWKLNQFDFNIISIYIFNLQGITIIQKFKNTKYNFYNTFIL